MPLNTKQKFGKRVRQIRREKKMSQLELSQKAKLDLTTINEIENGNRDPLLGTIEKISNALGVSLTYLFNFKN